MKQKIVCCCLAALLLLPLWGCGRSSDLTVVRVNEVTHSVFYAPQYVAMSLGFFEEEGLQVELTNGGGADKVMTAVVSGQSDIGLAGPESCIYVYNQGKEDYPVIFAQLTKRDGSFLVGRTDEAFSWENLRGKTIIGGRKGGVPEMTLEYVMAQNGVKVCASTADLVQESGKGYILCSIGEESGEIPYTAYFASQSYMAQNPQVIQGFTTAIARAQRWIAQHSDREVAEAMVSQFPDTSVDLLEKVTARHRAIDAWNATPVMAPSALERLEAVMEHAGELTREQFVDFEKLVDNSFAEKAAQ